MSVQHNSKNKPAPAYIYEKGTGCVQSADDLIPMLRDAFQQEVPAVIDCPVDYAENIKLSQYLEEQLGQK